MSAADRARGALYGLAIGDALGMPTQLLSRQQITARWGPLLTGFEPAPPGHPIAAGLPPGAVTDDTEQAVLLARMLVKNRGVPGPDDWAAALIAWELDMAERGSLDLLGPSTKRALTAVLEGTPPEEAGRHGDTNGAAMRITPVGIAFAAGLIDRVSRQAWSRTTRRSHWPAPRPSRPRSARASTARASPAPRRPASPPRGWRPIAATGSRAPTSRPASAGPPGWPKARRRTGPPS